MTFSLLVTLREGLEMALIVTILLGYLRSVDQKQHFREIWYGVAAAAGLSIAVGAGLKLASTELDGRVQEAFEGFAMLFARYWLAIPTLAIAGSLARKKIVPVGPGTLPTHTPLFVVLLIGVVVLVGALTFIPALALGPVVEHLLMTASR